MQRKGNDRCAIKQRRETIFRTLWINRARPAYIPRVDALNMIDVEFHGEKWVIEAWADLFAFFNAGHAGVPNVEQQRQQKEKYAALLHEMATLLDYDMSKTHVRDDVYRPAVRDDYDYLDYDTKRWINELLQSDALPVRWEEPNQPPRNRL